MYLTINYNTHQKKRGQSLRLRFPGIGKHPSYFERVMCPRYAQASIFTLVAFFNLPISENKNEKRTLFLYVVCTFICLLAYLFWCYTLYYILNSATLWFNFIYKFLSNKKFLLVASGKAERSGFYHVRFFTYLSAANQDKQKSSMTWQR